jgi:hypothetical protein
LASWVRKRRRVGRSVGVLIAFSGWGWDGLLMFLWYSGE